jgi:hypothetical protein
MDYDLEPREFTILLKGGPDSHNSVEDVAFQSGRKWSNSELGSALYSCKIMNPGEDILTLFTLPLDVIWKHQMGERYCTWARLVGLTVFMWFCDERDDVPFLQPSHRAESQGSQIV